jgi:hypothetical protein
MVSLLAKQSTEELIKLAGHLFEKQYPVISLWQTLSEHFYPERADFTITRNVGQELADSLVDSYPVLVRRDLGNSFSAMLRDGDWFKVDVEGTADHNGKLWLDYSTNRLKKMFYNRGANFVRATKEADHDYATFGQAVISVELNKVRDGLLFRAWHLRDCAWFDDETGQVGGLVRKWEATYNDLMQYFGDKNHKNIKDQVGKTPFKETSVRHLVLPAAMYGDDEITERFPYVSIWIDVAHSHEIEVTPMNHMMYVVPRFQTISGSPYAYSPATVVGLPDARALQAMTHTLLEAGERYARPPIIATSKVIRGDVDLSPDGITWVDHEYDEKLGASLRTLQQDRGGFPIGMEMRAGIVDVLSSAFYLNKITLPSTTHEMTAYEVSERMKQYRRENLPLFAPIEAEYNGRLCETAFEVAMTAGLLGSPYDIPESIQDKDVRFQFVSPLSASQEEEKATRFSQVAALLGQAAEYDEQVVQNVDFDAALRDAVIGTGAPAKWLRSIEDVIGTRESAEMEQEMAKGLEMANLTAEAAMAVNNV